MVEENHCSLPSSISAQFRSKTRSRGFFPLVLSHVLSLPGSQSDNWSAQADTNEFLFWGGAKARANVP